MGNHRGLGFYVNNKAVCSECFFSEAQAVVANFTPNVRSSAAHDDEHCSDIQLAVDYVERLFEDVKSNPSSGGFALMMLLKIAGAAAVNAPLAPPVEDHGKAMN